MNRHARRERGTATIEMAIVMPLSMLLLAMIVLAGRLTWHAIALTKSVADTNRIVATLPLSTLVGGRAPLEAFAKNTLSAATRSAGVDIQPMEDGYTLACGIYACVGGTFPSVTVTAVIGFRDTIFNSLYQQTIPEYFLIRSAATQTYATTTPKVPTND